jgi:hypothetical protein
MTDNFHAGLLAQLVEGLGADFNSERSIRLSRAGLFSSRFLLTVSKDLIPGDAGEQVLAICRRLSMPEVLLANAATSVDRARFFHFGFEQNETDCLFKVYLEFGRKPGPGEPSVEMSAGLPESAKLLHLAFKWHLTDTTRFVQTHYVWFPELPARSMVARLMNIYGNGPVSESRDIACDVLKLAMNAPFDQANYLEVTEPTNGRRSFDINLYDSQLRVREMEPVLSRMCRHFRIGERDFRSWYEPNQEACFGHVAGGVHRQGDDFFNIYYGMQRQPARRSTARTGWNSEPVKRLQYTTEQDQYYNYCWWPYLPVAATENKLRPVNLLWQSFSAAGLDARAWQLVQMIRDEIGLFRTVWGIKWLPQTATPFGGPANSVPGRLAWEYYFYDYQRREREISISRVLRAIRPLIRSDVPVNEGLPYFMFSLDVNAELLAGERVLDVVHMYVGNPGSRVSSGIAYAVTSAGSQLENFYFFFDAQRDLREAAEKIACAAHVDLTQINIDRLLIPELRNCHTICVANKQRNDTVYFSGVNVDQLLFFLTSLHYPTELISFVRANRDQLDHLLYDVGFDYVGRGDEIAVVKSGFYGIF